MYKNRTTRSYQKMEAQGKTVGERISSIMHA